MLFAISPDKISFPEIVNLDDVQNLLSRKTLFQLIGIAVGGAWGHLEQNQIGLKRKLGICLEEKVGEARVVAVA